MFTRRELLPPQKRDPLRVMFITTSMPVGGAEVLLVNLIRGMDTKRFSPELCCTKELGPLGDELAEEIPVFENLLKSKYDLRVLPRMIELFSQRKIDAVITVGAGDKMFWGRLAAYFAGVPVIASAIHSTGWPDEINWLNRRLTSITDRFIGVADAHSKHLTLVEGFPQNKVVVIRNGIDVHRFQRDESARRSIRSQLKIDMNAPVCGIVAALRPEKNHRLFLETAHKVQQQIPEVQFLVVGDGPERKNIESWRRELGLEKSVHLLGNRSDIPEVLSAMDLFLLTSKNEASPVSILEAMSIELPIVAPDVGSISQAVQSGETGLLVNAGSLEETAAAVLEILQTNGKPAAMGKLGREKVIQYGSLQSMVNGYQDLIDQVYCKKCFTPSRTKLSVVQETRPLATNTEQATSELVSQ